MQEFARLSQQNERRDVAKVDRGTPVAVVEQSSSGLSEASSLSPCDFDGDLYTRDLRSPKDTIVFCDYHLEDTVVDDIAKLVRQVEEPSHDRRALTMLKIPGFV
jgi:hypothetical protein